MLAVERLDVFIQSSHILRQISLEVGEREVVCLVGRNGAGKTTTLRAIMGYLRARHGRIVFRGEEIQGRRTHEIALLGLGFAPEDSGIFADLTVAENIEIATWTRPGGASAAERIAHAYDVFPVLRRYAARKGPEMSGGERKMLSIARALALKPSLLLLDEPTTNLDKAGTDWYLKLVSEYSAGRTLIICSNLHQYESGFCTSTLAIEDYKQDRTS